MEGIFGDNSFAMYIIACIAVISYTNFKDNQRMFLLYLFTYATAFFEIFSISESSVLLIAVTFIYLEYLTEDTKKLVLITNPIYKILDYLFMIFYQYHFCWVLLSFLFLHFSHLECVAEYLNCIINDLNCTLTHLKCIFTHLNGTVTHLSCSTTHLNIITIDFQQIFKYLSIVPLLIGIQLSISQPFKIKSITEICQVFDKHPPYQFDFREEMQDKFNLVCAFEDKTYFQRTNSYSCFTFEYLKYFLKNHAFPRCIFFRKAFSNLSTPRQVSLIFKRGYSTPEMQLIRTVGVARGYDKYKIQRKIFEIIYSKIILSSLKNYHQANTYLELNHYRHYLLSVYFQTVMTKIKGIKHTPLSSVFDNSMDISSWSMEGLFIACLGLCFREVSAKNLYIYDHIIEEFDLSTEQIIKLNNQFPQKFPSTEPNTTNCSL